MRIGAGEESRNVKLIPFTIMSILLSSSYELWLFFTPFLHCTVSFTRRRFQCETVEIIMTKAFHWRAGVEDMWRTASLFALIILRTLPPSTQKLCYLNPINIMFIQTTKWHRVDGYRHRTYTHSKLPRSYNANLLIAWRSVACTNLTLKRRILMSTAWHQPNELQTIKSPVGGDKNNARPFTNDTNFSRPSSAICARIEFKLFFSPRGR